MSAILYNIVNYQTALRKRLQNERLTKINTIFTLINENNLVHNHDYINFVVLNNNTYIINN